MEASGTLVNTDKSNVYFFNTNEPTETFLARTLGFKIGAFPMKYLGVPLNTSSLRIVDWKDLITRLGQNLQNWAFRVLNAPGRLIMLKSVLQSLPVYQLSGRAAPKNICNQMVNIFKKILW